MITSINDVNLMIPVIMDSYPTLGRYGLNFNPNEPCRYGEPGKFDLDSIRDAIDWINEVEIKPTNNHYQWKSSYLVKHVYEYYYRKRGDDVYMANGNMIIAAIISGLRVKIIRQNSPNLFLAVTRKSNKLKNH